MNIWENSMVVSLFFSLIISLVDYLSDDVIPRIMDKKHDVVSFTAGLSVTYIFLELLPDVYAGIGLVDRYVFLSLLVGFIIFHLAEKHIYKQVQQQHQSDLTRIHLGGQFLYHFIVGILIVTFTQRSIIDGFLLLVPVTLHSGLSNLSSRGIHNFDMKSRRIFKNRVKRVFYSLSPFYGAIVAFVIPFSGKLVAILTSFIAGILLYIVIREEIPPDRKGNPRLFLIGAVLYALFIIVTWLVRI